jgi:hypothetical protein
MKTYYIRIETWGTTTPDIIDEEAMYQAERRMNYLNPDDYMFLCDAQNMAEATETYWEEFSKAAFDAEAERLHP